MLHTGLLLGLLFNPEDGGDIFPKRRLNMNGLQGVVSQKTEHHITTAVITLYLTSLAFILIKHNETALDRMWLVRT
jgi:hypothetical protein